MDGKNVVGSSDNRNILHIIAEFDGKQEYKPTDVVGSAAQGDRFFYGSFEEMFTNVEETLAADVKSTTTMLNNYSVSVSYTHLDVYKRQTLYYVKYRRI